ncbi:MAG: methyltransferase domain-containing protein, partial [Eggerthellaceae bacterium]|nr:methyltransferase domain-containing protein [Eggerthellaceae bacterium]
DETPAALAHRETPPSDDELAAYYENACWEFGYASLCHMSLPGGLSGKTVLDVGCRRGKGVFKLSERVGAAGHAIGIDWVPDHIGQAVERADKAARETGLPANNMEFHLAYPENLMAAGVGNSTVDMAFINSILHLTCKPAEALAELHRTLKPGGLLVLEVALADGPRDAAVVEAARELGNSIQAAPYRADFEALLDELGFDVEVVEEPHAVEANMGFKRDHTFPTAPSTENVGFEALVLHAHKR